MNNLLGVFEFLGDFFGIVASFGSLSFSDFYLGWTAGSWTITYNNLYTGVSSSFRFFTLGDLANAINAVFPAVSGFINLVTNIINLLVFAPASFLGLSNAPFWFVTMVTVVFWGLTVALLSRVARLIKDLINPLN